MTDATRKELTEERRLLRDSIAHLLGRVAAIDQLVDGVPVYDVPPDWIGNYGAGCYPSNPAVNGQPVVAWWAKHPDGRFSPVYEGSRLAAARRR